jgi:hypothetical protein
MVILTKRAPFDFSIDILGIRFVVTTQIRFDGNKGGSGHHDLAVGCNLLLSLLKL